MIALFFMELLKKSLAAGKIGLTILILDTSYDTWNEKSFLCTYWYLFGRRQQS